MAPGSARKKAVGQSKADPGLVSPRKTPSKPKPGSHLVGKKIVCPGEVFSTPEKSYPGIVTRTGTIKGTPRLWVQFDEDKSNYWFPTTDVEAWVSESATQGSVTIKQEAASQVGEAMVIKPDPEQLLTRRGAEPVPSEVDEKRTDVGKPGPQQLTPSCGEAEASELEIEDAGVSWLPGTRQIQLAAAVVVLAIALLVKLFAYPLSQRWKAAGV